MARGGQRQGKPGKAYTNRTDLNAPKPRAGINRPAPGQQYGQATAQAEQMKAVNLQAPQPPDVMTQATEGWEPLGGSPLESQRPDEPVTAGLDVGPGPGSDVLPQISAPQSEDMERLIRQLPLLEELASHPNSSAQTRVLYRRVMVAYLNQQG